MGLSITGIAGPTGGSPAKPVGLVYIAISDGFGTSVKKLQLRGDRERIKKQAAQAALNLIRIRLNDKNLYRNLNSVRNKAEDCPIPGAGGRR